MPHSFGFRLVHEETKLCLQKFIFVNNTVTVAAVVTKYRDPIGMNQLVCLSLSLKFRSSIQAYALPGCNK
jgi:hypothetical protein